MVADPRDDRELIGAHVAGDPDAFGILFARHRDRLWAVALRTMGNPTDAADGLQDGLIAAYRRAGSYRGDAAVTTWLHRVIVNACLDRLRSAKIRSAAPLPEREEEYADSLGSRDEAQAPEQHALLTERRRRLSAALAKLPVDQRVAVVLVHVEGYSIAEAAELTGAAEGTIKSRCSRGRARLAQLLADLAGDVGHAPPRSGNPSHPADVRGVKPGSRIGDRPRTGRQAAGAQPDSQQPASGGGAQP